MSPGLLAEARHVVMPTGVVASGLPAVERTCRQLGLSFDDWQADTARCILAKDRGGLYAADTVVMSIPRQVGKTWLVGALVFADSIINPGTTTVWTAHRFKVARETFNALKSIALTPELAPHIDPDDIYTAAGNESITFRNGSRILFAARERGAVRGVAKVRRLVLDEAQILSDGAMADLAPTMNQAVNPQIILMGTPPRPIDPGEVFTGLRSDALSGKTDGVLYLEFSATNDADYDDRDAWRQANPSYPLRTSTKAILRMRKLLTDADFGREALGIWGDSSSNLVIPSDAWRDVGDQMSMAIDRFALAVDVAPDRSVASVALAGQRSDGRWHVELDEQRSGVGWLAPYVIRLVQANPQVRAVVIDAASPAASIVDELLQAKVSVTTTGAREMAASCGQFYDGVMEQWLRHTEQPQLSVALSVARKRSLGDAWAWNRKSAASDITPLVACTLALWGAQSSAVKRPSRRSGNGSVMVL